MNTNRAAGVAAAFALVGSLCACATQPSSSAASQPAATSSSAAATSAAPAPTPTESPSAEPTFTTSDVEVSLKTTEKQCFGSAGCNVTVEPKIAVSSAMKAQTEGTVDVTFKVTGDESGPVIETAELDLASQQYSVSEIYLSTSSSGVKPKAIVTEVEYTAY